MSLTTGDESRGKFLLSQFKEKSAIIQSSSEPRSQSPTTSGVVPKPRSIPSTAIGGLATYEKLKDVELLPTGGVESSSQSLLSHPREQPAPIKASTGSPKTRRALRETNGSPPKSSRTQSQSLLSQFRQSSALLNSSTLPDPAPGDRFSTSGDSSGKGKVVTRRTSRWHKGNTSQSEETQKLPSASSAPSVRDSREGNLSPGQPSSALHPVPRKIDPATSKSPKLAEFASRLSSLTTVLYNAIELLPQMALQDLESVLENDWMVEDMEKMVMGVVSLVNGRDGEKQWRSGGGNGKL